MSSPDPSDDDDDDDDDDDEDGDDDDDFDADDDDDDDDDDYDDDNDDDTTICYNDYGHDDGGCHVFNCIAASVCTIGGTLGRRISCHRQAWHNNHHHEQPLYN